MNMDSILKAKGGEIISVRPNDTIEDTARLLAKRRIGAVLVCDDKEALVGILSERDIVRGMAHEGAAVLGRRVSSLMTKNVVVCSPKQTVDSVMDLMTERRIRHLPVVHRDKILGVISIGDVVKEKIAEAEHEAEHLREYIATG